MALRNKVSGNYKWNGEFPHSYKGYELPKAPCNSLQNHTFRTLTYMFVCGAFQYIADTIYKTVLHPEKVQSKNMFAIKSAYVNYIVSLCRWLSNWIDILFFSYCQLLSGKLIYFHILTWMREIGKTPMT